MERRHRRIHHRRIRRRRLPRRRRRRNATLIPKPPLGVSGEVIDTERALTARTPRAP